MPIFSTKTVKMWEYDDPKLFPAIKRLQELEISFELLPVVIGRPILKAGRRGLDNSYITMRDGYLK